jgi:aldehyde dehydrogenase (NAD+)
MTSVSEIFKSMEYGPAPEADQQARQWLGKFEKVFGQFINGEWTEPGQTFDVINPANREVLARVTQGTKGDVDAAVSAARAALPGWQALDGHARARYLYALARGIQKHSRLFAVMESMDNGKSIRETRDIDIPLVARHFYHHAGWAQLLETEFPGYKGVGVVGQIIPWNFPLLMLAWKVAPALASGSTVVLKPAEFTPLTALVFCELAREVGLPPGVLNVITGDGRTGAALVDHADVDKIAFTGSTDVGKIIRKATAGSGKKLSLELGGKSPFIVYDDADLDSVVEGVVDAIWFNQGQVCCAGSRLLVQEGISDRLIEKLRARMEKLRIGSPLDKAVDMGAIVAPVQLERIRTLVQEGQKEGATMWQPSWACPTDGYFYPPTLFTDVTPSSMIAQVEIFGPVLVSMTFRTPEESVALANNTPFGLAASLWTESINLALDIAPKLKSGVVWINSTNLFDASAGFGGYRESGFGREGGREGMWEYLKRAKNVGTRSRPVARQTGSRKKLELPLTDSAEQRAGMSLPPVDRTPKLFIGGKQARPDQGYSRRILGPEGTLVGEVPDGNRKDVRNAVESAHTAWKAWGKATGHLRGQILYYIGENLAVRADEFATRLAAMDGRSKAGIRARGGHQHPQAVHLRRVGRQVGRRGAQRADSRRGAGDERADRCRRNRVRRRVPAARLRVDRGAGYRRGQHDDRHPVAGASARGDRLLQRARDVGRSAGGDQHRHGRQERARQGARGARRRGGRLVRGRSRWGEGGRAGVREQHEAHLDQLGVQGPVRRRRGRGARVPARSDAGEEHLGSLWGIDQGNYSFESDE